MYLVGVVPVFRTWRLGASTISRPHWPSTGADANAGKVGVKAKHSLRLRSFVIRFTSWQVSACGRSLGTRRPSGPRLASSGHGPARRLAARPDRGPAAGERPTVEAAVEQVTCLPWDQERPRINLRYHDLVSGRRECCHFLPPSRGSGYHFPASATFERALRFEESSNEQIAKYLAPAGTPVTTNDSFAPAACGAGSPERLAAIQ